MALPRELVNVGNMIRPKDLTYIRKDGERIYAPPGSPYHYKTPAGKKLKGKKRK